MDLVEKGVHKQLLVAQDVCKMGWPDNLQLFSCGRKGSV